MAFKDTALLTLINTVACLAFPKLLSMILTAKSRYPEALPQHSRSETAKFQSTSFPYCTVYILTSSQSCKFSPDFCGQCSPN
jgi:hypothetical protein